MSHSFSAKQPVSLLQLFRLVFLVFLQFLRRVVPGKQGHGYYAQFSLPRSILSTLNWVLTILGECQVAAHLRES